MRRKEREKERESGVFATIFGTQKLWRIFAEKHSMNLTLF